MLFLGLHTGVEPVTHSQKFGVIDGRRRIMERRTPWPAYVVVKRNAERMLINFYETRPYLLG